jgi:hypothetical protein
MTKTNLPALKSALAAAVKEDAAATASGTAKWDDALDFAYKAMPQVNKLIQAAEFLADALPGIKAYATSIDNETARSMWDKQIEKYEACLNDLGVLSYNVTVSEIENVLDQYRLRIVDRRKSRSELAVELHSSVNFVPVHLATKNIADPVVKRQAAFTTIYRLLVSEGIIEF